MSKLSLKDVESFYDLENVTPTVLLDFIVKINNCIINNKYSTFDYLTASFYGKVDSLTSEQLPEIDKIYQKVDVSRLPITVLISLIRVPYSVRHKLTYWEQFRNTIHSEFAKRGKNSDLLLRGLYERN